MNYELFDNIYYLSQIRESQIPSDPLEHYLDVGWKSDLSPSPYFDVQWYKLTNPELATGDVCPFTHYLTEGSARDKDPHPSFFSRWYRSTYLANVKEPVDPLLHYATVGWLEGHNPCPLFWTDWYNNNCMGTQKGQLDPFLHFLSGGLADCNPNPLFDICYYQKEGSDHFKPDPLSHYIHVGWKQGRSTHPMFDVAHWLSVTGLSPDKIDRSPLQLYFEQSAPRSPCVLFDPSFFLHHLLSTGTPHNGISTNPLITYITLGWRSTIDPHPFFSKRHYYMQYPDVYETRIDALSHYLQSGWKEQRSPHPLFDAQYYCSQSPASHTSNPLIHYLNVGSKENLDCRPATAPDTQSRDLPSSRITIDLPINKHSTTTFNHNLRQHKIGIFAHIYYLDLVTEIVEATNRIPNSATLFVSTDSLFKARLIEKTLKAYSLHPFEIRLFPNRGRDIAPMIVGYADRLREVDLGVHIHTKKSKHYDGQFDAWRRYLIGQLLGTSTLIENILAVFDNPTIGAYAAEHFEPIKNLIQWGGNFTTAKALLWLMGQELTTNNVLDFPSGSMFWFRTAALSPLLNLGLTVHHFEQEKGQTDGTLAHAIERCFYLIVEAAGYDYVVGKAVDSRRVERDGNYSNRFFPTEIDKGVLRHGSPELTRFFVRSSSVEKPRINLLIPTVDTTKAYGGVATALEFFISLHATLNGDFDSRLIATDATPGQQYCPPSGYILARAIDRDCSGTNVVVDGAQRYCHPVFVRKSDVFVATAWWTAHHAVDIIEQQRRKYGSSPAKFVYFIQDMETGFYPWSTKHALAEATYKNKKSMIPVFNSEDLFREFQRSGMFDEGRILRPAINRDFERGILRNAPKERNVLLYARPHAERNCLQFLDALVEHSCQKFPEIWRDWRFLAIGEDFHPSVLRCDRIEVVGRLAIQKYAELASHSALGVSLMVSPHPSYPPLELAEAGVLVLSNVYHQRRPSSYHENLREISSMELDEAAYQLMLMATEFSELKERGWSGRPKIDWFFGGRGNMKNVVEEVAAELRVAVLG